MDNTQAPCNRFPDLLLDPIGIVQSATKAQVEMVVRCKAFSGEVIRKHRVKVDDVSVRVLDPVSGHYTLCHSLSKATVKRIIARAEAGEGR